MRALAGHEDREQIVKDNPDLTQGGAREIMRAYKEQKAGKGNKREESADAKEDRRWFKKLVIDARKLLSQADIGPVSHALAKEIEPKQLPVLREVGKTLIKLADSLQDF